jgi:dTMP kinase
MFVVIEGIDGSGKGTQTKLLKTKMEGLGYEVKYFSFPGYYSTVYGKLVGKYLNNEFGDIPIEVASTLFAVDRFERREKLISAIDTCDLVLCDRWCPSNMAYSVATKYPQSTEAGLELEFAKWIDHVDYGIFLQPVPDIVFHLQISVEKAADLIAKKEPRCYTGDVKDKYENDFLFQSRVASLYSSLVSKTTRCHNWHQIKTEHENGSLKDEKEITEEFILPLFSNGF